MTMIRPFAAIAFGFLLCQPASALELRNLRCADRAFVRALMDDINGMPNLKNAGLQFLDISDARTLSRSSAALTCNYAVHDSDGDKYRVNIQFTLNSFGELIFELSDPTDEEE